MQDTLCTIVSRTGFLRRVFLVGPRFHADALLVLAETNIELKLVQVYSQDDADRLSSFTSQMVDLVESMSSCKNLQKIALDSHLIVHGANLIRTRIPSVTDACIRYRGRSVSIRLDKKEYNPWKD